MKSRPQRLFNADAGSGATWKLPGFRRNQTKRMFRCSRLSATQTPPPNNAFFGREALVDGLVTDFQQDVRVVCLKGPGASVKPVLPMK